MIIVKICRKKNWSETVPIIWTTFVFAIFSIFTDEAESALKSIINFQIITQFLVNIQDGLTILYIKVESYLQFIKIFIKIHNEFFKAIFLN
ncbi:hypothetical protein COD11_05595 [Bacillus sp. AFS040349]|nr:hypothetical protein COD11_05595 [Bacillus sp. AFS040349]